MSSATARGYPVRGIPCGLSVDTIASVARSQLGHLDAREGRAVAGASPTSHGGGLRPPPSSLQLASAGQRPPTFNGSGGPRSRLTEGGSASRAEKGVPDP